MGLDSGGKLLSSIETRLRNSLLSFIKIKKLLNNSETLKKNSFRIDKTHIVELGLVFGPASVYRNKISEFSLDGILITVMFEKDGKFNSSPIEFDNAEILTVSSHEIITKISYYGFHGTENPASKSPGVRGLSAWLRFRLGSSENFRKFLQNLEMLNINMI